MYKYIHYAHNFKSIGSKYIITMYILWSIQPFCKTDICYLITWTCIQRLNQQMSLEALAHLINL